MWFCLGEYGIFIDKTMGFFFKNIGEWLLDRESVEVSLENFGQIPEMKRICKKEGEQLSTEVLVKDEAGAWVWFASSKETYNKEHSRMHHQTRHLTLGDYHGVSYPINATTLALEEFNTQNQKISEGRSIFLNEEEIQTELTSYTDPWGKVSREPMGTFKMRWIKIV